MSSNDRSTRVVLLRALTYDLSPFRMVKQRNLFAFARFDRPL